METVNFSQKDLVVLTLALTRIISDPSLPDNTLKVAHKNHASLKKALYRTFSGRRKKNERTKDHHDGTPD